MSTIIITHEDFLHHDTGPGHPERPDRIRAVWMALEQEPFAALPRREAPPATPDQLKAVHLPAYVDMVLEALDEGRAARLDPDTVLSPGSRGAVLRAAGAVCAGVDAVVAGEASTVFCAVRPCGHHAEQARPMGFCVFNNVAVGMAHARNRHGIQRIACVDFDVHHGNGTQAMFYDDGDALFASTHQSPLYPGTGAESERGRYGTIINVPLAPGSATDAFMAGVERRILPALDAFKPELLFISAGFDAHADDPLAGLELEGEDFARVTRALVDVARRHCGGRIVSVLEGGYDLAGLADGCMAHVRELMAA
ncbi:histone deacetylase family protein [Azospirillum halopraeferens]|uniref:histone deacetylase family protein n=1 Tax=Azospirillum halopraeferens TaxID=34010 RepID=UPI000426C807|nr:histone deacetylase family protein [Azospirillum halopraeferens]